MSTKLKYLTKSEFEKKDPINKKNCFSSIIFWRAIPFPVDTINREACHAAAYHNLLLVNDQNCWDDHL